LKDLFQFVPGYRHYVYGSGREPLFFLLLALLLTFVAVRTFTRLGRVRSWRSGSIRGVHLHHLVPGVIASLVAGTVVIAFQPGGDAMLLLSALFGVGAALTLDEFALILHLDDVYWTDEGRSSIEATLMGLAFGLLCLLATAPLGSDPGRDLPHWVLGGVLAINLIFALVAFLKGKVRLGAFGLFLPGVAPFAAARLGQPASLWARRFYTPAKLARSRNRADLQHRRYASAKHRVYDAIGGAPHLSRSRAAGQPLPAPTPVSVLPEGPTSDD
jgi:lysyl-tRNA synthetase class 2